MDTKYIKSYFFLTRGYNITNIYIYIYNLIKYKVKTWIMCKPPLAYALRRSRKLIK